MRTVNEIALEQKVELLEKEIVEHKKFESGVIKGFTKILMGTMLEQSDTAMKGFEELKKVISEKVETDMLTRKQA